MDNYLPKISVVTPSFNQGQFLDQTMNSVLGQDYSNVEYIVVDGGSTDNSVEIIKKYADRLAYWVSEKDRGQTHAINKGLEKSTGDVLCYLNSDDQLLPHVLSDVAEYFVAHGDVDCVYGCTIMIDQNGSELLARHEIPFDYNILLYGIGYIQQPSTFWRRSVYEAIGPFQEDLQFNMDYEYWIRMASNGFRMEYVDKFLSLYRLHNKSKSVVRSTLIRKERKQIRKAFYKGRGFELFYGLIFPLYNIFLRFKRQAIKIFKYGRFEFLPGHLIFWFLRDIKKQYE